MVYRVIGLMSGSSLDGLDIVFTELEETGGKWNFNIQAAACYEYDNNWLNKLMHAKEANAFDYFLLHHEYGVWTGEKVNEFIEAYNLHHQVQLVSSHGHTVFHAPHKGVTSQLGNGADMAAVTGINVVCDLRSLDVAFKGQGAPIVPMGEKLLWPDVSMFLNIGGISNLSFKSKENFIAFDVCSSNRVLNMLAQQAGKQYDEGGNMAQSGQMNETLLTQLNDLDYYKQPSPKSLPNEFGTDVVFPIIQSYQASVPNALRTYVEHIAMQVISAIKQHFYTVQVENKIQLMVTGGGALNHFLLERLHALLQHFKIEIFLPDIEIIQYKEALIMALLGVLRWREENTVMKSVTGARRSSIGGAVWIGQEA